MTIKVKSFLESIKPTVRVSIDNLDKYWSGKIVAEAIRTCEKKYIKEDIYEQIKKIVKNNNDLYINTMFLPYISTVVEIMKPSLIKNVCNEILQTY